MEIKHRFSVSQHDAATLDAANTTKEQAFRRWNQCFTQVASYLCFQHPRPDEEAGSEKRVVGANSIFLDLDGSHYERVRFLELAL